MLCCLYLFIFYNICIYAFFSTTLPRLIIDLLRWLGMYRYSMYFIYDLMNTFVQELNIELPKSYICNLLCYRRTKELDFNSLEELRCLYLLFFVMSKLFLLIEKWKKTDGRMFIYSVRCSIQLRVTQRPIQFYHYQVFLGRYRMANKVNQ